MGRTPGPHRMGQAVSVVVNRGITSITDGTRPIDRLPTEILCRIFSTAAEFLHTAYDPSYLPPHCANLVLLKITAVCQHWRSIASECAILWTNIAFDTSTWSTIECAWLFLSNSKQADLSVYIWDSGRTENPEVMQSSKELLKSISSQTHRFSTCQLSSTCPNFWRHWVLPAPNLRKLLLHGHGPVAPPAFRGDFPQLEVLTSHYCTTWPLGNYATLTHVELNNHSRHVPLTSLLDALMGCAALEGLTLEGYHGLEGGVPHLAPIHLPRLRQIDIISSDSALILEHLDVPSMRGPVIIFNPCPRWDIIHSLPSTRLNTPYLEGITTLVVDLNSDSPFHYVAGFRGEGPVAFYVGAHGVPHWAKWSWTQLSFVAMAYFAPFSSIRTLTLTTNSPIVPWELWLPNLGRVERLTVSCPKPDSLLAALLGSPPETMLPSLHSLTVYRRGRYSIIDHTALREFVFYRYRKGRPLRQLRLNKEEWGWIQRLDAAWTLMAQSQRKRLRITATRN